MKYYKVKREYAYNQYFSKAGNYLGAYIANELYTPNEVIKHNLNLTCLEPVEVSKRKVYWRFGARFKSGEFVNGVRK